MSCVSIIKLWTCFSALVSSSFFATTATTRAVQPAPCRSTSTKQHPFITSSRSWSHSLRSHHDAGQEANSLPAVRVWDHVPVSDGEEGDRDQPHGSQEVAGDVLAVVIPANTFLNTGWLWRVCTFKGTVRREKAETAIAFSSCRRVHGNSGDIYKKLSACCSS